MAACASPVDHERPIDAPPTLADPYAVAALRTLLIVTAAARGMRVNRDPLEPISTICLGCRGRVLVAIVAGQAVVADPYEWEPRARCFVCATIAARGQRRANCDRCGGSGYVGEDRPPGRMLAIDVAWSDTGHVRTIGPRTPRRKGEALYRLHPCSGPAPLSLAA